MPFQKGNQFGKIHKGRKITWGDKISIGLKKAYKEGRAIGFPKGHKFFGDLSKPNYFQKGYIPWNKGKLFKNKKICQFCKKEFIPNKSSQIFCSKKCSTKFTGKSKIGIPFFIPTKEHKEKLRIMFSGKGGPNWKGGTTKLSKRIRGSAKFANWRKKVFARDNWTCQKCGQKGGNLHPHHIKLFSLYPKLRFRVSNGITLCNKCHKELHRL
jgi:ribosomal protein L37AE/L43A